MRVPGATPPMRVTVTYEPDDRAAAAAWFERWASVLASVSDNLGCGCCVEVFEVEGPPEALAALPEGVSAEPTPPRLGGA